MSRLRSTAANAVLTVATSLAVVATPLLLAPQAADAGTNGQQIDVYSKYCFYGQLIGTNQNGTASDTGPFEMPKLSTPVGGWWWIGSVTIRCWDKTGAFIGSAATNVPKSQSGDWWYVHVDPEAAEGANTADTAFERAPLPNAVRLLIGESFTLNVAEAKES